MTRSEYCAPRTPGEGRLNIFDNGPCAMQPVFGDYDQKALDDAYDQAVYAPNRDQLLERRNLASEAARRRLGEPQRFAYGGGPNEQLDVYPTRRGTHVQVFVHGGACGRGRGGVGGGGGGRGRARRGGCGWGGGRVLWLSWSELHPPADAGGRFFRDGRS